MLLLSTRNKLPEPNGLNNGSTHATIHCSVDPGRRQQIRVVDSPTPTPISSILHSARKALKEAWLYFRLERAVAETCCAPLSTLGTQLALVYSSQTHVPWFTLRKVVWLCLAQRR
jgi:hypothetical protein